MRYFPHHEDYLGCDSEFRPYAGFADPPRYRSSAVNTDQFGLREHYDFAGEFADLESAATRYPASNVILGSSTVFGVDTTSDRETIAFHLNEPDRPCFNLGVRGFVSRQELILFLLFRKYFPRVRNIVIFSGINNASWAALPGTTLYKGYGGFFYERSLYRTFWNRFEEFDDAASFLARQRMHRIVDSIYDRVGLVRAAVRALLGRGAAAAPRRPAFDEKLNAMLSLFAEDLEVWNWIRQRLDCRVHFVLQPVIGWTRKPLTRVEKECFEADFDLVPSMRTYARADVYEKYRDALRRACDVQSIDFHDSNEWLNDSAASDDLFTDICHTTDAGNRLLAGLLRQRLRWLE